MGTGILAIALSQFQAAVPMLHSVAEGLWMFNIALFTLFAGLYAARWIFFFDGAKRIFGHSVVSMFFGCIPMGLATIVNGFLIFGCRAMASGGRDRRDALVDRRRDGGGLRGRHPLHDVHAPEPHDRPDDRGLAPAGGRGRSRRRLRGTARAASRRPRIPSSWC